MGLWDKVKNIMSIPDEDEFDEEFDEVEAPARSHRVSLS